MKTKIIAVLACTVIAASMFTACGSSSSSSDTSSAAESSTTETATEESSEAATEVTFDVDPEFDPNSDYDKYTVFEYTIEDAGATFPVTLSANEDETKFEIHCNFYGDEQLVTVEKEGDEYVVKSDKTGFMETDSPAICQAGVDNANWATIG